MRTLNKNKTKGEWISFPEDNELKFQIRPLSISNMNNIPSSVEELPPSEYFAWFNYMCTGWSGYTDENGKELECNDENKRLVFDHDQEIAGFVIKEGTLLNQAIVSKGDLKN